MKHYYTSTELIHMMANLGWWYDDDSSYKGYIVFRGTDDGWTAYPLSFSTWREVAEWYEAANEDL